MYKRLKHRKERGGVNLNGGGTHDYCEWMNTHEVGETRRSGVRH